LSLLEEPHGGPDPDTMRRATEAIDEIRERFGDSAIGQGSSVDSRGLRLVRRGAQQWGPDDPRAAR
jgi:hypothetical protein